MCSDEPIVDIQIPGRARVSFGSITADKVPLLLETVLLRIAFHPNGPRSVSHEYQSLG